MSNLVYNGQSGSQPKGRCTCREYDEVGKPQTTISATQQCDRSADNSPYGATPQNTETDRQTSTTKRRLERAIQLYRLAQINYGQFITVLTEYRKENLGFKWKGLELTDEPDLTEAAEISPPRELSADNKELFLLSIEDEVASMSLGRPECHVKKPPGNFPQKCRISETTGLCETFENTESKPKVKTYGSSSSSALPEGHRSAVGQTNGGGESAVRETIGVRQSAVGQTNGDRLSVVGQTTDGRQSAVGHTDGGALAATKGFRQSAVGQTDGVWQSAIWQAIGGGQFSLGRRHSGEQFALRKTIGFRQSTLGKTRGVWKTAMGQTNGGGQSALEERNRVRQSDVGQTNGVLQSTVGQPNGNGQFSLGQTTGDWQSALGQTSSLATARARQPAKSNQVTLLNAKKVKFTKKQICVSMEGRFASAPSSVYKLWMNLVDGGVIPEYIPPIDVYEVDGDWWVVSGNRRLWAFKQAASVLPGLLMQARVHTGDQREFLRRVNENNQSCLSLEDVLSHGDDVEIVDNMAVV